MEAPLKPEEAPEPSLRLEVRDGKFAFAKLFWGPDGLRVPWRLLAYYFLFAAITTALFSSLHPWMARQISSFRVSALLPRESIVLLAALFAAWIMAKVEGRAFGRYGLPWRNAFRIRFWEGAAWGFIAMSASLLVLRLAGSVSFGAMALVSSRLVFYALAWGALFLVGGVFEEFFFRGYPQFTLAAGIRFWPAAIVLSLAFGAVHLGNPGENWRGAAEVFVIAMLFCLSLRRTGDLWFAVGLHAAWDWAETFFYGVPNSGLRGPGHLLEAKFHGPDWLTGGSVGPEASGVTLAILLLMMWLLSRRFPRAPRAD